MNNKDIFLELTEDLTTYFDLKSTESMIQKITDADPAVFSTSLGLEDQVITDQIVRNRWKVKIFTLDTGRLFNETYALHMETNHFYKIRIETVFPDTRDLEKLINEKGPDSFFDSVENRRECCHIRKVKPLKRALEGYTIWLTGIRKSQSPDRANMEMVEFDETHDIIKVHPLLNWTDEELDQYIKHHNVPVNPLHKQGYPSIGCSPCTRAVHPGEDPRAGRWWWESGRKECGLHTHILKTQGQTQVYENNQQNK